MAIGWLCTDLDATMLGGRIHTATHPLTQLPERVGTDVFDELSGRPLLRFLPSVEQLNHGAQDHRMEMFVTPTPYSVEEMLNWLALSRPELPRRYVIRIDPRRVAAIKGPRWCSLGGAIEYFLPHGYPLDAVMAPGWAVPLK